MDTAPSDALDRRKVVLLIGGRFDYRTQMFLASIRNLLERLGASTVKGARQGAR